MQTLRVTQIGNSLGVILPKDALVSQKLEKGDALYLSETSTGFMLSKYDPQFEQQMDKARIIMRERRAVLHELAK